MSKSDSDTTNPHAASMALWAKEAGCAVPVSREEIEAENRRLRELLRGFRAHYGDPVWHDRVTAEIGPVS